MNQQSASSDPSPHMPRPPISPHEMEGPSLDWRTLARLSNLDAVREAAHHLATHRKWQSLQKLAERMEDRREILGPEFLEQVANYRQTADGLPILHTMCAQGAPEKLISAWVRLGANIEALSQVTFNFPSYGNVRGLVRAFHIATVTGNVPALLALHHLGADVHAPMSSGIPALALLAMTQPARRRAATLQGLLACGINPFAESKRRRSYFEYCLHERRAEDCASLLLPEVVKQCIQPPSTANVTQAIIQPLISAFLENLARPHDPNYALWLLSELEKFSAPRQSAYIVSRLSAGIPPTISEPAVPALHLAVLHPGAASLVSRLLALGLDGNQTATIGEVAGQTALHVASAKPVPTVILALRKHGSRCDIRNARGETPQELLAKLLLFSGRRASTPTLVKENIQILFGAVEPRVAEAINLLSQGKMWLNPMGMLLEELDDADGMPSISSEELVDLGYHDGALPAAMSFSHHVLMRKITKELREDKPDSRSLSELLPSLLDLYDIGPGIRIAAVYEALMDKRPELRHSHANLVELMALLNHPREKDLNPERIGRLVSAITSTFRYSLAPDGRMVRNWATIGTLGFSFGFWKYDTRQSPSRKGPSLFEQYGLERCPERPSDTFAAGPKKGQHWFGPRFLLRPRQKSFSYRKVNAAGEYEVKKFDASTSIELRRSYISVSHPNHGTLIIRNSSRVFGRDLFPFPAYWSARHIPGPLPDSCLLELATPEHQNMLQEIESGGKTGEAPISTSLHWDGDVPSEDELVDILEQYDPEEMGLIRPSLGWRFSQALHPGFTHYRGQETPSAHMAFLLEQFMAFKQDYAAWKCDTRSHTAWQDWDNLGTQLVGGHFSPGFQAVVAFLEEAFESSGRKSGTGTPPPDLAFVHPYYPPWSEYQYTGSDRTKQSRLPMNGRTLEALAALARGQATDRQLEESGVRAFLQEAGYNTQGELVLLDHFTGEVLF